MKGLRVLITAGPTRERLDPVRFLTNASSGAMGYALAAEARRRGAAVVLVSGPVALETPKGVRRVDVESAEDMRRAALKAFPSSDVAIAAAAVGDWRFARRSASKIKRKPGALTLRLLPNKDIVAELAGKRRPGQLVVGFALETGSWLRRAQDKLERKGLDLIVANTAESLASSRTRIAVLDRDGAAVYPPSTKARAASRILDKIVECLQDANERRSRPPRRRA